jgi:hypothetical protein
MPSDKIVVGEKCRRSKWPSVKNAVGQNCRRSKIPSVKMAVGQSCVGQKTWNHLQRHFELKLGDTFVGVRLTADFSP